MARENTSGGTCDWLAGTLGKGLLATREPNDTIALELNTSWRAEIHSFIPISEEGAMKERKKGGHTTESKTRPEEERRERGKQGDMT
jgi:hypothetical protein